MNKIRMMLAGTRLSTMPQTGKSKRFRNHVRPPIVWKFRGTFRRVRSDPRSSARPTSEMPVQMTMATVGA